MPLPAAPTVPTTTVNDQLDARDAAILAERVAALDAVPGVRVGDYVRFPDLPVLRRVSYVWRDEHGAVLSVQTTTGGSFYLGRGYVSMSGGMSPGVPEDAFTLTDETRGGSVWFFHHDWHTAHNGVDAVVDFRVFAASTPAPR